MKARNITAAFVTAWLSTTAIAAAPCPLERAHYTYSASEGTAEFKVISKPAGFLSAVVLHLNFEKKRDLWYLFDQGNARYVSLISTMDPTAAGWEPPDPDSRKNRPSEDQKYFAWNDDLKIAGDVPQAGDNAPEYILVPDLPETLQWLQHDFRDRLAIGSGIFRLTRCSR